MRRLPRGPTTSSTKPIEVRVSSPPSTDGKEEEKEVKTTLPAVSTALVAHCQVGGCQGSTHQTRAHPCQTCGKHGHGVLECGKPEALAALVEIHQKEAESMNSPFACPAFKCPFPTSHSAAAHFCRVCARLGCATLVASEKVQGIIPIDIPSPILVLHRWRGTKFTWHVVCCLSKMDACTVARGVEGDSILVEAITSTTVPAVVSFLETGMFYKLAHLPGRLCIVLKDSRRKTGKEKSVAGKTHWRRTENGFDFIREDDDSPETDPHYIRERKTFAAGCHVVYFDRRFSHYPKVSSFPLGT